GLVARGRERVLRRCSLHHLGTASDTGSLGRRRCRGGLRRRCRFRCCGLLHCLLRRQLGGGSLGRGSLLRRGEFRRALRLLLRFLLLARLQLLLRVEFRTQQRQRVIGGISLGQHIDLTVGVDKIVLRNRLLHVGDAEREGFAQGILGHLVLRILRQHRFVVFH